MDAELRNLLKKIYDEERLDEQSSRYTDLIIKFEEKFGKQDYKLFSSPGRAEIGGNHTDHNHGKVIAASVNLDSIAVAYVNPNNEIILYSVGYKKPFVIKLNNIEPIEDEKGSTAALLRGIAAGFKNRGYKTGGFNAFITSDILIGSGLSSSASIEILIGTILNHFYNDDKITSVEIVKIGQYSENNYFGKPCGLMDQITCATGGIIAIDFFDPEFPIIKKIDFDFSTTGYKLIVVDTEANHSGLTEDYAAIPAEMKQVAKYFGKEYCSEIKFDDLLPEIKSIRKKISDRAILRAIHFLKENRRVDEQIDALNNHNFERFLSLVNDSGDSSFKYLQNIFSPQHIHKQGLALALALSNIFIKQKGRGACRVHGGGFAGTILVIIQENQVEEYTRYISNLVNEVSIKVLSIRDYGAVCLDTGSRKL
ncbi:MAG: galactokinase family protein [Ignavibacteriaceae bacterium]